MAFNGAGIFVRLFNWVQDKNNGIDIDSTRMDQETDGIATGLSNAICKDGQSTITADIPFATHKITGLKSGTVRTDAINLGQVQDGTINWVADTGAADAIAAAYSPPITILIDGQICFVRIANANLTTTPTFSPNGLTARTVTKFGGAAVAIGDMQPNMEAAFRYLLASTRWEWLNPRGAVLGANTFTGAQTFSSTVALNGATTMGAALNETRATIASATTTNIGAAAANYLQVTGTTAITAFDTVQAGTERTLEFAGVLTLTHNSTSLILPGGASIITTAGDIGKFVSEGSGNWRCISYRFVNGTAIQVFTSSGTYTPTPGMRRVWARAIGGGGAAGGAASTGSGQNAVGSGGNGGAVAEDVFTATQIGTSQTVTIGTGGAGVSGSSGNSGSATTLGALLSAAGGEGGVGGAAGTVTVTSASVTSQSATGSVKGWTYKAFPGIGYVTAAQIGGDGGGSFYGGGGNGGGPGGGSGSNGSGPGAGGGGSSSAASSAARTGGSGANGELILIEYFS